MKWRDFLRVAYPSAQERAEADQNVVFKANRRLGLRVAYLLYHLGLSANLLSLGRLVLALVGFYLVSRVGVGDQWGPVMGAIIIAGQIHLDFVDGPLARIRGQMTALGERFDALPNDASRAAALILAGFLTNNAGALLSSTFSAFVLVVFIRESNLRITASGRWRALALVYSLLLYVPVMAFVLPLIIGVHGLLGIDVATFARLVVLVYALLAVVWLLLCLFHSERRGSPLEHVTKLH